MKDATPSAPPVEHVREKTVIETAKHAVKDATNGGSPITNGHADEKTTLESEASVDAYENSLLHNSDCSDSENLNLELELSDEEDVDSSASTIALASVRGDVSEATTDGSQVTSTTEGETETTAEEGNVPVDLESEGSTSSDCVEVPESEPIVDPKSSTNTSSDAATDSCIVSMEAFSEGKEADVVVQDTPSGDANAGKSGDGVDLSVVDDSGTKVNGIEEGGESPRTESEVVGRLESARVESVDKELPGRPEIQVIDLDDSSSESDMSKSENGAHVVESEQVTTKLDVRTSSDADDSLASQQSADILKETVDEEETKCEVLKSCKKECEVLDNSENDVKDNSEKKVLEPPESGESKDDVEAENAVPAVDELKAEGADVDKLAIEKVIELTAEKEETTSKNLTHELAGEPVEKLTTETCEDTVDSRLPENTESVDDKEVADEGVSTRALPPRNETSSPEVTDQELVGKDEVKAKPTFTVAEIVAQMLDSLIADVVSKSEGTTETVIAKDVEAKDETKLDVNEVFSISDESNESNSASDLEKVDDKAIAEPNDVKDVKPLGESVLPKDAPGKSEAKDESVEEKKASDKNPIAVASEKDDSKTLLEATPKPNSTNLNTAEVTGDPTPRRPKRSTVQKAEELALSKKMKMNNSSDSVPNSVRSVSKENLNPAQKRGSVGPTKDDSKKARVDSLRKPKKKKELSNLDKAIARVASGGMSTRTQELAELIGQVSSKKLEHLTTTQLEDLILYKIGKYILEQSDCAVLRKEVAVLKAEVDKWQSAARSMAKQVTDLENVMKKMITDIKTLDKDTLPIPAKVNRSVGLQVGDGRISNDQKKLAIPRIPMPPPSQPVPPPPTRRPGIMTNRSPVPVTATVGTVTMSITTPQRLRSPTSTMAPPRRSLPPLLAPGHRTNVLLPSNSPPRPPGAGQTLPSAGLTRRSVGSVAAKTPAPGALIDLTDGDDAPAPKPVTPSSAIRQVAPSKIRVLNPVNTTTATSAPAGKPGSIRLVTQSALTGVAPPNARVAYVVPASTAGGESRMYFATTAPKQQQQVSVNGATVVQRPAAGQTRQVVYSTVAPALRGLQPGTRPTTYIAAGRPAPGSVVRARPVHIERKVLHPAPLPPSPASPTPGPGWKKPPPFPELKISKCDKRSRSGGDSGIILSWKMDSLGPDHDDIKSYQLYAYQETTSEPSTTMWKKVGEVTAMALPMACTLTQFTEGNKYHFAVRAVDVRGRIGPFSKPGNILLSSPFEN